MVGHPDMQETGGALNRHICESASSAPRTPTVRLWLLLYTGACESRVVACGNELSEDYLY